MTDRRVLTMPPANTREAAETLLIGYQNEPDPRVEQVGGRWAVTAAKTKKEGR